MPAEESPSPSLPASSPRARLQRRAYPGRLALCFSVDTLPPVHNNPPTYCNKTALLLASTAVELPHGGHGPDYTCNIEDLLSRERQSGTGSGSGTGLDGTLQHWNWTCWIWILATRRPA